MSAMVYVSLGSNVQRDRNIRLAVKEMRTAFGNLSLSPVYESASVGFDGSDFLNLVAGFETNNEVHEVVQELRVIEDRLGRDRSQPRFSPRPIDLDILTYDGLIIDEPGIQIPREEILQNAFVLKPLCDIAPDSVHPLVKQDYQALWLAMASDAPRLELYELSLD
ncbi:MAG: 2-amino-4-hydroxy-6-hydroxymethyldihydropteridine diphosphokinase [Gammaproteobacteria bacterium]|nr:MAG: 2-amino-4-hydroxy-6-hydroxymethyldihydropteridine diphosphokinase [Gammaproteobacteria bacterium]